MAAGDDCCVNRKYMANAKMLQMSGKCPPFPTGRLSPIGDLSEACSSYYNVGGTYRFLVGTHTFFRRGIEQEFLGIRILITGNSFFSFFLLYLLNRYLGIPSTGSFRRNLPEFLKFENNKS